MATDTVLSLSSLPAPAASASRPPGASPVSPSSAAAGNGGSPTANPPAPQPAQPVAAGFAAAKSSRGATSKGSPPPSSFAQSVVQSVAQSAGQSPAAAPVTAVDTTITATSADDTPATVGETAKGIGVESGKDEPEDPAAKHSTPDPVSAALALLSNALGGVLAGAAAIVPAPLTPTANTTSTSSSSSTGSSISSGNSAAGVNRALNGGGVSNSNTAASALETLLAQSLATDPGAAAANPKPNGASAAPVAPAPAATAAAAALTAAQLTSTPAAAAQHAKADPTTMTVSAPVGSSAWTDELGTKLTWMAHQGIQSASLQLSPEHLGPLQVTISVRDGQASVWFGAAQPDTRTALQQSLPQLRQLFASQGLTLADAGVSRESPRGQERQRSGRGVAVAAVATVNLDTSTGHTTTVGGLGLVDTYA